MEIEFHNYNLNIELKQNVFIVWVCYQPYNILVVMVTSLE